MTEKTLLPNGFYDVLPKQAIKSRRALSQLMECFSAYGYNDIQTPVLEFEESMFANAGRILEGQSFRLMDPISHRMMALRSDITPQITRMVSTRLANEAKPLRLCYQGQVFHVQSNELAPQRQLQQAGIELVGDDSIQSDIEVVKVAIEALSSIELNTITIDFATPDLVRTLVNNACNNDEECLLLSKALAKKDLAKIESYGGTLTKLLLNLADPTVTIDSIQSLDLPEESLKLCQRVEQIIAFFAKHYPTIHCSFDPLESLTFPYHNGVTFSIFAKELQQEIARGGRYQLNDNTSCTGCTVYVNRMLEALNEESMTPTVLIPLNTSTEQVTTVTQQGYRVQFALSKKLSLADEAKNSAIGHYLEGDVIVPTPQ